MKLSSKPKRKTKSSSGTIYLTSPFAGSCAATGFAASTQLSHALLRNPSMSSKAKLTRQDSIEHQAVVMSTTPAIQCVKATSRRRKSASNKQRKSKASENSKVGQPYSLLKCLAHNPNSLSTKKTRAAHTFLNRPEKSTSSSILLRNQIRKTFNSKHRWLLSL